MNNKQDLAVKLALQTWDSNVKRMTASFDGLSDEQMHTEIAPGRNRPVYLLGHMAVVHDMMIPLLGLGERKLQHLDSTFITSPDKAVSELPSVAELKSAWAETNETLNSKFASLSSDEWFQRHTNISEEDFAKEPHRNRLSVLNSRANHVSYHIGQLALVKK